MIARNQVLTVSSISSNIRTSRRSRSSSCILHLSLDSKYALSRTGQWSAGYAAPASPKAPDPLRCCQLLVSLFGCEFRPDQLERDAVFFVVHQREDM